MYAYVSNDGAVTWTGEIADDVWASGIEDGRFDEIHFLPVVFETRPSDTDTTTYEQGQVEIVDGVPTVRWYERPKTPDEIAADTAKKNKRTIEESLDLRMAALQAILDDTNSNINTNPAARIKDLARALRLLVRMARNDFGGTA